MNPKRAALSATWMVVAVLTASACSEDDAGPTNPPPPPPEQYAEFSSTEAVFNNSVGVLWIESNLTIFGYEDRGRLTVGGYWYRKRQDGSYHYVTSACPSNVPNNRLGNQYTVTLLWDLVTLEEQKFAVTNFSCFSDQTGTYYGRAKVHDTKSIGVNPNHQPIAVSDWVAISWSSKSSDSGQKKLVVRPVSEEELLELHLWFD